MSARPSRAVLATLLVLAVVATACGAAAGGASSDADADTDPVASADDGTPSVVVTTAVLGSLVQEIVGDADLDVVVLMDPGADPHSFAPSARDAERLAGADLVIANGLGLETALLDALEAAEDDGVEVVRVAEAADPVEYAGVGHAHEDEDDYEGEDHAEGESHAEDEDHAEGESHAEDESHAEGGDHAEGEEDEDHADGHDHEGELDPHVWLDPVRIAAMVEAIGDALAAVAPADGDAITADADEVAQRYVELGDELEETLARIPDDRRRVATNHDSFGYFATRYDFEVVATVLPGSSTQAEPSAADVAALVELVTDDGVAAILTDAGVSDRVAVTVAAETDGVELIEVFSGSLGEAADGADTLEGMLRTNAERLVDALG